MVGIGSNGQIYGFKPPLNAGNPYHLGYATKATRIALDYNGTPYYVTSDNLVFRFTRDKNNKLNGVE